jgi:hypothetical protein
MPQNGKHTPAVAASTVPAIPAPILRVEDVPFYDGFIRAGFFDGDGWVPFKPLCKGIGLGYRAQEEKVQAQAWATVRKFRTVAEDGHLREVTCINLDTLAGWLMAINANDVRHATNRDILVRYQKEACRTLRNHFFGPRAGAVVPVAPSPAEVLLQTAQLLVDHERRLVHVEDGHRQMAGTVGDLARQVDRIAAALDPVLESLDRGQARPLTDRDRFNNLVRTYAAIRQQEDPGYEFHHAYNQVYRQYNYRYHCNLKLMARRRHMSPIAFADKDGRLRDLLAVAVDLFLAKVKATLGRGPDVE